MLAKETVQYSILHCTGPVQYPVLLGTVPYVTEVHIHNLIYILYCKLPVVLSILSALYNASRHCIDAIASFAPFGMVSSTSARCLNPPHMHATCAFPFRALVKAIHKFGKKKQSKLSSREPLKDNQGSAAPDTTSCSKMWHPNNAECTMAQD